MQRCETPSIETSWHISLLTLLLVFGACARFYGIDQLGLSFNELNVLATCDSLNWLDMAIDYNNRTGMTPLYPALLCEVTDWTGRADVFVRLLSVLTGLGILFVIYMIGRDFISPVAGLFAATLAALDYQLMIASREASVYSLLTLLLLLHHYYFCQLFFASNRYSQQACSFRITSPRSQMLWHWQPDFPGNARFLAGFWITGILAFYTSPMTVLQLAAELLASFYMLKRSGLPIRLSAAMRTLWLPVFLATLPWLPVLDHYTRWALDGNLFGLSSLPSFLQQTRNVLPVDMYICIGLIISALLLVALVVASHLKKLAVTLPTGLFVYSGFLILLLLSSLATLKPASHLSLMQGWVILLLMLVTPYALLVEKLPATTGRNIATMILMVIAAVSLAKSNQAAGLYERGTDADFRLAARILQADEAFMNSRRKIYLTSPLFNHYLDEFDVSRENIQLVSRRDPAEDFHEAASNAYFYYLEYRPNMAKNFAETAASKILKENYPLHCETQLGKIRVLKFARSDLKITSETGDCLSYLPRMSSL